MNHNTGEHIRIAIYQSHGTGARECLHNTVTRRVLVVGVGPENLSRPSRYRKRSFAMSVCGFAASDAVIFGSLAPSFGQLYYAGLPVIDGDTGPHGIDSAM